MPTGDISIEINATSEAIFDLIHDYSRRLDWDSFLRDAHLLEGARQAGLGVSSRCSAHWSAGGMVMDTQYISFTRPTVAAVKMTRGPILFRSFAASIRQVPLADDVTRVTYCYSFESQPRWLAWAVEPIIARVFRRETHGRLHALKRYLEADHHRTTALRGR